jgi:ABC-2 type transport system ATP-binding protein
MIEIDNLSKKFKATQALSGVTFSAPTGSITGFLGPNGAGKTTTLRILLGLARPSAGTALIDGKPYRELAEPRRKVGAVLDSIGYDPGRTGRDHLRVVARAAGIGPQRVGEVLEFVELEAAADRPVGGYSQGMRQRLALATALLGDPPVLVLDEPANGLDPAGITWLRKLLRGWASQGRTVLFSSHVLAEVESVADHIVIIDRGRVVRQGAAAELYRGNEGTLVRTGALGELERLAGRERWRVRRQGVDGLVVEGVAAAEIGRAVAANGIALTELSAASSRTLEDLFMEATAEGAPEADLSGAAEASGAAQLKTEVHA